MKMTKGYKICTNCGEKVDEDYNFCPNCKSQSFRKDLPAVRKASAPDSLTHRLFYWNYDGEYVLAKSKVGAAAVLIVFLIATFASPYAAGMFVLALLFSVITFLLGYVAHYIRPKPEQAKLTYNDYGFLQDLVHLMFFWQNKNTGEYVLSKTKVFTVVIFVLITLFAVAMQFSLMSLVAGIIIGFFIDVPVFLIGFSIHKLTNPNPTNPKRIEKQEPPKKVERKFKVFKRTPKEVESSPFSGYETQLKDLKAEFKTKDKAARELIEKRFEPPQITYTRFITLVDKSSELFEKEAESAQTIIDLASEDSPRIRSELDSKIDILKSITSKIDELTNELILSMDSSEDADVDNLIDDMQDLISSVKDYDD